MFDVAGFELPIMLEPSGTAGTLALTTDAGGVTANYLGLSFVATDTQLSSVNLYCSAATGATKLRVTIRTDTAGAPSASSTVLTGGSVQKTTGLGVGFINVTGFSCSLTVGTRYWIVCYVETDASQSITLQWYPMLSRYRVGAGYGWSKVQGTTIDTLATSGVQGVIGYWLGYSSGHMDGIGFGALAAGTTDGVDRIYGTKGCGFRFTTPNTHMKVQGVAIQLATKTGSPTGTMVIRIYSGTSLVAQSLGYPCATVSAMDNVFIFSNPVQLLPNTTYRAIVEESTTLNSVSAYSKITFAGVDSVRTSMLAFNPCKSSVSAGTFTDDLTKVPLAALLLGTSTPFPTPPLNRRQFNSMR